MGLFLFLLPPLPSSSISPSFVCGWFPPEWTTLLPWRGGQRRVSFYLSNQSMFHPFIRSNWLEIAPIQPQYFIALTTDRWSVWFNLNIRLTEINRKISAKFVIKPFNESIRIRISAFLVISEDLLELIHVRWSVLFNLNIQLIEINGRLVWFHDATRHNLNQIRYQAHQRVNPNQNQVVFL